MIRHFEWNHQHRFLLVLLAIMLSLNAGAVRTLAQGFPSQHQPPQPEDEDRARLLKEMAKKANEQRHAELRRDSENLLKKATELKEYVDKSSANLLSVEVIRKAEEIERLAHNVKEKMKGD